MPTNHIYARNGKIVEFDSEKVRNSLKSVMESAKKTDLGVLDSLTENIISLVKEKNRVVTLNEIESLVEYVLFREKQADLYKAYLLRRLEKTKKRNKKSIMNIFDEIGIDIDATKFLTLCLEKDSKGIPVEDLFQMFMRVARNIAQAEYL